jgi:hypothetical protein
MKPCIPPLSRPTFALLLAGLLIGLFLQFRPLDDVDLFWQVRAGLLMLDTGRLVERDAFTFTHAGDPVPTISWLAQLIFAGAYRVASWPAVRLIAALAFAAALTVAGLRGRNGARLFSLLSAVALGLLVLLPHTSVRPQAFGILGFSLLLALAHSTRQLRSQVLLAAPLLLVWQNLHPSVLVGGIALVPTVAVRWFRWWRKEEPPPVTLMVLLLLVLVSQFATPLGWNLLPWTRLNTEISHRLRISEWMPPWDASVVDASSTFWLALAGSLVLLAVSLLLLLQLRLRFCAALEDLALFLVMTVLALSAARFAAFWAVALIPCWVRWIEALKPTTLFAEAPGTVSSRLVGPLFGLGSLLVLLPLLRPGKLFSDELPWEGIQRLQAVLPEGRIYNYREWGGPLIFAGFPQWPVAIDGRLYLFSDDEWTQYNRASRGEVPLSELVEQYRPDAFFLRPTFQPALIAELRQSGDWKEVYSDAVCSAFIRRPR